MAGAIASLYECDTTLEQIIKNLGLAPISSADRARIRSKLSEINGRGLAQIERSKKLNPEGKLQTKAVVSRLKAIATCFQTAEPILRGLETGFHSSHEIEIATRIREALTENVELKNEADEYLRAFCDRMNTISQACVNAATEIRLDKRKAGKKAIDWHDDFAGVLVFIAERNDIRVTITINRVTGKPKGRFLEIAAGFEQLLYPAMRSSSRGALAKRLSRSLTRLKQGQNRSR